MSHYIRGEDRGQATMFPARLDDYVEAADLVRVIDRYVECRDLRVLGFKRFEPAATGRPGYDPRVMLKLYLYGYLNRVRSSRRLERESQRNVELMWLLGKLSPDFKSIADFRRDNGSAIRGLCREFSLFCVEQGLIAGALVAIDGSKFAGVNHKGRNLNAKQLAQRLAALDEKIAAYLKQLDSSDAQEAAEAAPDPSAIREALAQLERRKGELVDHQKALAESGESQVSLTDPDARRMTSGSGTQVGYNVQTAVDAAHKLIVNFEVTNDGNDLNQLSRQAEAVKALLGVEHVDVVADAGYAHGTELERCEQAGITVYVPARQECRAGREERFGKDRFTYDAQRDEYRCPADQTLSYVGEAMRQGRQVRRYTTSACNGCPRRAQCTTARKAGREIVRVPGADAIDAAAQRVRLHPDKLALRKTIVEHPFGTLKRTLNHGYFLMKGLAKVTTEMSLSVLSYNLKRVINILGADTLIRALAPA